MIRRGKPAASAVWLALMSFLFVEFVVSCFPVHSNGEERGPSLALPAAPATASYKTGRAAQRPASEPPAQAEGSSETRDAARDPAVESPPRVTTRHWAVLASKAIRDRGISDLLTAKLADEEGFDLVEREQIDKVFEEQTLSELFSAESVHQRLRLGSLLKADRLLILEGDLKRRKDKPATVRLAIVDTGVGADLFTAEVSYQPDKADQLVGSVVKLAQDVQHRFAGGVKAIVGIPFFVSNTLDDEYDSLQKGFSDLLAAALTNTSGIAVVSIDQARHIRWELDLTGDDVNGVTSLFVFGKFRIEPGQEDKNRKMDLQVTIENGNEKLRTLKYDELPIEKAPETVIGPVATAIVALASSSSSPPADLNAQAAMFGRRADELKKVNALAESLVLRESILLLVPDNVPQRTALIYDYLERPSSDLDAVNRAITHTRFLLQNRLVTLPEGIQCVRSLSRKSRPYAGTFRHLSLFKHHYFPPEVRDSFLCEASLLPGLLRLPPEEDGEAVKAHLVRGNGTLSRAEPIENGSR